MAPVLYRANLVEEPELAFNTLLRVLEWEHAGETVPRKEYYVHNSGLPYSYGQGKFARTYVSQPTHPIIEDIRTQLKEWLNVEFDVVFLNLYEHERHHLGWHADDSPEMSDDYPIVTVSLGATREIWFRSNTEPDQVSKLMLDNGSACVMLAGMQDTHQHRIPKCDRTCGPRISLTFRKYVHGDNDVQARKGGRILSFDEQRTIEMTNEYGHLQTYMQDEASLFPVCSSCHAMVMPNRGQGMLCDQCSHDIFIEMSHDYDMGEL